MSEFRHQGRNSCSRQCFGINSSLFASNFFHILIVYSVNAEIGLGMVVASSNSLFSSTGLTFIGHALPIIDKPSVMDNATEGVNDIDS